jgi:acyl carrier protein
MGEPLHTTAREEFTLLSDYVEPQTETEKKVAEIWRQKLQIDRIGITDEFENLGGSSLTAASILSEVSKTFGIKADIPMLIEAPTIREFALRIDDMVQSARV